MKKIYSKPLIMVEELTLDQSIANCEADKYDMESLINDFKCFTEGMGSCHIKLYERPGYSGLWQDKDGNGTPEHQDGLYDTICYHSNIETAFLS